MNEKKAGIFLIGIHVFKRIINIILFVFIIVCYVESDKAEEVFHAKFANSLLTILGDRPVDETVIRLASRAISYLIQVIS